LNLKRFGNMFRICPLLCLLLFSAVRSENCDQDASATLYCRGERALRNVLRNLNRSERPLVVVRGLEIVPLQNNSLNNVDQDQDQSLLDSLSFYLRTHEINVKLADLLEDEAQVSGEFKSYTKNKWCMFEFKLSLIMIWRWILFSSFF